MKHERMIINLDLSSNPGTHWTALIKRDSCAYYFDPFGDLSPPEEIVTYLGKDIDIYYNRHRYQNFNSHICGHLSLKFLLNK